MGYEVTLIFHPRKEDGSGYDTEVREEKVVKFGKPFDDVPLEKLAAGIMSEMARRDIWVVDVRPVELVRREVPFKPCKDGRGIVLKSKKFSFNESAQLIVEDVVNAPPQQMAPMVSQQIIQPIMQQPQQQNGMVVQPQQMVLAPGQHPHEMLAAARAQQPASIDDLYANPNKPVPVSHGAPGQRLINPKKVLYKVYIDHNNAYGNEYRRLPAKLSLEKEYPVHAVIPSVTGRLDAQKIAITDDSGKIVEVDEKYFTSVGMGLVEDQGGRFSGNNRKSNVRKPKLAYEDEMYMDNHDPRLGGRAIPQDIPIDDGSIPDHLLQMPEIRPGKRIIT